MSSDDAPGQLEYVREFVNTLDFEDGEWQDALRAPDELADWLAERDLLPEGVKVGDASFKRGIELREALQRVLLANNGVPGERDAVEDLNRTISDAAFSVRFPEVGRPALTVRGAGPGAAVAPIVAIVYEAMIEGTWPRLKACPADDCHWAFYDHSKNHSGTWCDMAVCGNRAKVRAYRERKSRGG